MANAVRAVLLCVLVAMLVPVPGCTARTLTVTSSPPGAEVSVNRRPIGVTPCRVGFTHYGTYRIEIRMEKYEPLVREECITPQWYGYDPITVVVDNAIPARINDDIYLHYILKKEGDPSERVALLARAAEARQGIIHKANGETVQIAYAVPPKTPEQEAQAKATAAKEEAPEAKPQVPPDQFKIKILQIEEPAGPKISKELNIKPVPPDKKPDAPKTPNDQRREPGRTPKGEELIFDPPAPPKSDSPPKSDAPKKDDGPKDAPKAEKPKSDKPDVELEKVQKN